MTMPLQNPAIVPPQRPFGATQQQVPTLCKRCSDSLPLDDLYAGGHLAHSSTKSHVDFVYDEDPQWPDNRTTAYGGIDYELTDTTPDLSIISESAAHGCMFCIALRDTLLEKYSSKQEWKNHPGELRLRMQYEWFKGPMVEYDDGWFPLSWADYDKECWHLNSLVVCVWRRRLSARQIRLETPWRKSAPPELKAVEFKINAERGLCADWLGIYRQPFGPSRASEGRISKIQTWIQECDSSEDCCAKADQPKYVPSRLLDLGTSESSKISLLEPKKDSSFEMPEPSSVLKYATLSYCWGNSPPILIATLENLDTWKEEIPILALKRCACFWDTIEVTRKLGIRYIWIDALCIIQDDAEDWENESAQMYEIFSNSFITIGAAASNSCQEGFLNNGRGRTIDIPFKSSIVPSVCGIFSICLLTGYSQGNFRQTHFDFEASRWNTRGWVFQERQTARKLVLFGSTMITMICPNSHRAEDGSYGRLRSPTGNAFQNPELVPQYWGDTVQEFSEKRLTYPRDRLSALSGLVRAYQGMIKNCQYVAGHWVEEEDPEKFIASLLWDIKDPKESASQSTERLESWDGYIAPSWSWAPCNQPITWKPPLWEPGAPSILSAARIDAIDIMPAHSDPTVALGFGSSITLTGKLGEATCISSFRRYHRPRKSYLNKWIIPDEPAEFRYQLDWNPELKDASGQSTPKLMLNLFLLLELEHWLYGLLLRPATKEHGAFHRIGTFVFGRRSRVPLENRSGETRSNWHAVASEKWELREVRII